MVNIGFQISKSRISTGLSQKQLAQMHAKFVKLSPINYGIHDKVVDF